MDSPIVSHAWASNAPLGELRCVSCGRAYKEFDGGGLVFDRSQFVSLCKGCVTGIIRLAASNWPSDALSACSEGVEENARTRAEDAAGAELRRVANLLRSGKIKKIGELYNAS